MMYCCNKGLFDLIELHLFNNYTQFQLITYNYTVNHNIRSAIDVDAYMQSIIYVS